MPSPAVAIASTTPHRTRTTGVRARAAPVAAPSPLCLPPRSSPRPGATLPWARAEAQTCSRPRPRALRPQSRTTRTRLLPRPRRPTTRASTTGGRPTVDLPSRRSPSSLTHPCRRVPSVNAGARLHAARAARPPRLPRSRAVVLEATTVAALAGSEASFSHFLSLMFPVPRTDVFSFCWGPPSKPLICTSLILPPAAVLSLAAYPFTPRSTWIYLACLFARSVRPHPTTPRNDPNASLIALESSARMYHHTTTIHANILFFSTFPSFIR